LPCSPRLRSRLNRPAQDRSEPAGVDLLGTLLGVGAALALELAQRRVRSADDLVLMLDVPVLVTLESSKPPSAGKWYGRFRRSLRLRRSKSNAELKLAEVGR
jgi:hypothetical protein